MSMPDVRAAYDGAATAWLQGPQAVYSRLAEALVAVAPVELAGARVLDVGAGTATSARAALGRGAAFAVASDIAAGMLRSRPEGVPAVLADIARLPFPDRCFDLVTAAFCLGHLADPALGMREIRRVGSAAVASAFPPGPGHPVKEAVDRVFAGVGFTPPEWYQRQKGQLEPRVDDPDALRDLALGAGFSRVEVHQIDVDTGLETPAAVVRWRLGMAHLAPFVATLAPEVRARATAEAEDAVASMLPVVIPMLALGAS